MLDRTWAVLQRRCQRLPVPLVVADSWFGDSALLGHVHTYQQGTVVVEGKRRYVFLLPDGRRLTGEDLRTRPDWPWRQSPQAPGRPDARLTATSPTDGRVTLVLVDTPGEDRFSWRCQETLITAPRLIRAWSRRRGIEQTFRTVTHLLVAEACHVRTEDASYGPLGWRVVAGLALL
jgi:hypothetical protein